MERLQSLYVGGIWMKKLRAILLSLAVILSVLCPPGMSELKAATTKMSIKYAVHIQTYGDSQGFVKSGKTAGTVGQAKRLEAIKIQLTGNEYTGSVVYRTHVQSFGWQNWTSNGIENGSRGLGKRLEGIEIYLTGEIARHYDITYRVQCQTYGWLPWVKNGVMAGTTGQSKRLEAIQIKLVPKSDIVSNGVMYTTHCQSYGWLSWVHDGETSGTSGQAKRLEAISIRLTGNEYAGGIKYRTHIQTYGWENNFAMDGGASGTTGVAKRLEAIEIKLYGEIEGFYDVYYRVHAQTLGWMGWAKNGEKAGTAKMSKRLEAIQIRLVPKGQGAPESDDDTPPFVEGSSAQYKNNSPEADKVVSLCNQERRKNGVYNDLVIDPVLAKAAEIRANELVKKFSHTRPDGSKCFTVLREFGYKYSWVGENIAAGYGTPDAVMKGWMNSEGHRANILKPEYRKVGVACVKIPGSEYGVYWVQIFSD